VIKDHPTENLSYPQKTQQACHSPSQRNERK